MFLQLVTAAAPPPPSTRDCIDSLFLYTPLQTSALVETYASSEELETPSPASQNFWRNVEYLIYGDGIPSMIWNTTSRARRDEVANRQTVYNWMFGIDLSHAPELAKGHPYLKPTA